MTKTYRFNGIDGDNIPRVWGEGPTKEIAETRCRDAVLDYVARRPDTGPVRGWFLEEATAPQ